MELLYVLNTITPLLHNSYRKMIKNSRKRQALPGVQGDSF